MITRTIHSFGHYEDEIQRRFIKDNCGIQLENLGQKKIEKFFQVDLNSKSLINDIKGLQDEIAEIISFVHSKYMEFRTSPIWYKINVVDQASNEYAGIGSLNIEKNWISFILNYLSCDRAEQGGDTIIALFDIEFKWATSFTLSQDNERLIVTLYKG